MTIHADALAKRAILAVSAVKTATEAFDRGDDNVFTTLHAIIAIVEAYREASTQKHGGA